MTSPPSPALRQAFREALQFRFACKRFDPERRVARADLEEVLEAGRLSPSALGLEPWRFLVIEDPALRRRLRPACWNQEQITTAGAVIVIRALKAALAPESEYVTRMLTRLSAPAADLTAIKDIYRDMAHRHRLAWSIAQCHIAAANMMTAAAVIGLDSCPIGGFDPEAVAEVLQIDREQYAVALLLALGYRAQPQPPKQRLPLAELVEYRGEVAP